MNTGEVKLIYCIICREFYEKNKTAKKLRNFQTHVASDVHQTAKIRSKEDALTSSSTSKACAFEGTGGSNSQTTLVPHIQKYTALQRSQLTRTFQLAHYMAAADKSSKAYESFAKFEKQYHHVDLGDSYLTDTAGAEMATYVSISKRIEKITEPLNNNISRYYSVLMDGSRSVKSLDEKEHFIIKTCVGGEPKWCH